MKTLIRSVSLGTSLAPLKLLTLFMLGTLLTLLAPALALADPAQLQPCRVFGISTEVLCGSVKRPLQPQTGTAPAGVQIDVHFVVVPALARRKLPDPVFMLAGGPGQSAIALAPLVMRQLARANNRRDIVLVDQRGTGKSAPLECPREEDLPLAQQVDTQIQAAALARCLEALKKLPYGDLRFFTTVQASQDLEAVRLYLGVGPINLIGGSYGTRAALDYARQFPQSVRRSVLDGIAPPDMVLPVSFVQDGQAALQAVFASCEQEAACAKAHPALRSHWEALRAALPKSILMEHPVTGQPEQITLTIEALQSWVRVPLYSPVLAAALPQAIDDAARGRWNGLLALGASGLGGRKATRIATGMHLSVVCAEDLPLVKGGDSAEESVRFYQRACAKWPRGDVPAEFYNIPLAQSPTLLLSGGLDPATPPRHGERVATALGPKAQHIVVPNAGHGVMGMPCMSDVLLRFLDAAEDAANPQALKVDASCAARVPRPGAFVGVSLAGVSPVVQGSRP